MVSGLVPPRIGSPRHGRRSTLGPLLADLAGEMGVDFYAWQRHFSDVSTELVPRHGPGSRRRLAAGNVGGLVGRQSGKTTWAACRVALQCLAPELPEVARAVGARQIIPQHVGFTAQDRIGALGRWWEHVGMIQASPLSSYVERVKAKNGEECVYFRNGSTYKVITPSRTGARGLRLDLAIVDEALAHEAWLLATIRPTMAQRDTARGCFGAQFVLISNAGDERSTLLNEQRDLGRVAALEGDTSRVWCEWSADEDADPYDEATWRATIPTLDAPDGISLSFVRAEASSMRPEDFRREYLCVHTTRPVAALIDPAVWAVLPATELEPGAATVLAVDATRERDAASVVAAGPLDPADEHGVIAVEVVDKRPGVEWVAGYVAELADRHYAPVVVDAYGPMASIIPVLERAGVIVHKVQVREVVDAASRLCDLIAAGRIAHMRDPRLDDAVAGATRRAVGDRWCFSRKGAADISPLVAGSLAVWGSENMLYAAPMIHAPRVVGPLPAR